MTDFNKGTPIGTPREYSRIPCVVSPSGSLTSHHHRLATKAGPGVKVGDWLLGDRVTDDDCTHYMVHSLTVLEKAK